MFKKYNLNRAKIHYKKISIIERMSIMLERIELYLKDSLRFIKLDRYFFKESIMSIIIVTIGLFAINYIGNNWLNGLFFRKIQIINSITQNVGYVIEHYSQYLLACLGVAGFLAALFLSNLSGIITSRYNKITSRVSLSVLNEYANKKYLKSIINYLCIIVIQLLFWTFKINISILLSIVTFFLTIRIIIIYFELAKRVFLFSDINTLTKTIYHEINIRFMNLQNAIKFKKKDSIFDSYSNQFISLIGTFEELQKQIIKEEDYESISDFTNNIIAVAVRYSEFKNTIPVDSKWFKLKYEPTNWFEASFYEVNIRTQTGTSINNKEIADYHFLEDYIKRIFFKSIEVLLNQNSMEELYKIVNNYYLCFDMILSNCGDFEYWNEFNNELEDLIISKTTVEDDNYKAIIDFTGLNKISVILNLDKYTNKTYSDYFGCRNQDIRDTMLSKNINNKLFTRVSVNKLISQLRYEKKLEKKYITSEKYVDEYLAYHLIKDINAALEILKDNYTRINLQAQKLREEKNNVSACILHSRIIEIENKIGMIVGNISLIYEKLLNLQYNFSFDNLNTSIIETIKKNHYDNLIKYAQTFLSMTDYDYNESKIDFCGQIFYEYSEAIFCTILDDDYEGLKKLYKYYASICLMAEGFLYNNLDKNYNQNYLISKYKIPIIMYMELNGYIIYHSHIIKNPAWEKLVEDSIGTIIRGIKDSDHIIKRMAAFAAYDDNVFDFNDTKLNFRQRYSMNLEEKKLVRLKNNTHSIYGRREIDSDDDLINQFTSVGIGEHIDFYYKFYEIFIEYYINPKLDKSDKYKTNLKIKKAGVVKDE